jgi:hypothetical protein
MINRCIGKDAMAKVKDMARSTSCLTKNAFHFFLYPFGFAEKKDGVEVPLNSDIVSQTCPGLA